MRRAVCVLGIADGAGRPAPAAEGACQLAAAAALIDAIGKHNEREPERRVLFLNYSAVDPILTNEKCSFWH
ncbi:MAG TPA: hypothetical protein PLQ12_10025, partial [Candidatus Defluviicoccus seviourii]|nr:hypothetical protein [Candidatus Defluviicoccus seviourii]